MLALMPLSGHATREGTTRYRDRFPSAHPQHFRSLQDVWASSIGLGTYLGDPDDATDQLYAYAVEAVLRVGCNVLDTAINYRCQRSERVIGRTLARLIEQDVVRRDEVILCTKGGYVPFDDEVPRDPGRYITDTFLNAGIMSYEDVVSGYHCLSPRYLDHQLTTSLRNLGVSTIDCYYLHNPEQQLEEISREALMARMEAAFQLLEEKVTAGAIRFYGTATWNGYRTNLQAAGYLSLDALARIAERVGGSRHHFRVIQLPYNLAMPEAWTFQNQLVQEEPTTVLKGAQALGISVVTSAALLQSRLTRLPQALVPLLPGLNTDAQRAVQFARSTPGVTTALVGMKQAAHVEENCALAALAPFTEPQLQQLFQRR